MTTPGIEPPEDVYVPGSGFGHQHQGMSMEDAKEFLAAPYKAEFGNLGDILMNTLNGILNAVVDGIVAGAQAVGLVITTMIDTVVGAIEWVANGIASLFGVGSAQYTEGSVLAEANDAQLALNERIDLLNDVSGFATAYVPFNFYRNSGSFFNIPYNSRVGPQKNATVNGDGTITVAKGTWQIHGMFASDQHDNLAARFQIEVLRPDGTVYSHKEAHSQVNRDKWNSYHIYHPVVIPGPGYKIRARFRYSSPGGFALYFRGGTHMTHLSVNRLDLSAENAVVDENVPDE